MNAQQALLSMIDAWFLKESFKQVRFEGPTARITTHSMDQTLVYKLRYRPHYTTFYTEATGGALIVFEVSTAVGKLHYEGYCPLLLFGIWERKLSFKADAGKMACYRKEGHLVEERLKAFFREQDQ